MLIVSGGFFYYHHKKCNCFTIKINLVSDFRRLEYENIIVTDCIIITNSLSYCSKRTYSSSYFFFLIMIDEDILYSNICDV